MESIDRKMQQRVWQRVQQASETVPPAVQTPESLLCEELTDAARLRTLSLSRPAQQTTARAEVLRGICRLSGTENRQQVPGQSRPMDREETLRHILLRLLQRHRAYRQLCDHAQFGPLYEDLARQIQTTAVLLARTVGNSTNHLHNKRD